MWPSFTRTSGTNELTSLATGQCYFGVLPGLHLKGGGRRGRWWPAWVNELGRGKDGVRRFRCGGAGGGDGSEGGGCLMVSHCGGGGCGVGYFPQLALEKHVG